MKTVCEMWFPSLQIEIVTIDWKALKTMQRKKKKKESPGAPSRQRWHDIA